MNHRTKYIVLILLTLSVLVIAFQIGTVSRLNEVSVTPTDLESELEQNEAAPESNDSIDSDQEVDRTELSLAAPNDSEATTSSASPVNDEEIFCTQNFDPVCGMIGGQEQTFTNRCEAEKAGASSVTEGICSILESCPVEFDPVCAVMSGAPRTYNNRCEAEAAGATDFMIGECEKLTCNKSPESYCGFVEGVETSFNTECLAVEAGATEIKAGSCPTETVSQTCEKGNAPVCGKIDGQPATFATICEAENAGAAEIVEGECQIPSENQ